MQDSSEHEHHDEGSESGPQNPVGFPVGQDTSQGGEARGQPGGAGRPEGGRSQGTVGVHGSVNSRAVSGQPEGMVRVSG